MVLSGLYWPTCPGTATLQAVAGVWSLAKPLLPSHSCAAILQVVAGAGLLLLSLGALAWQARHWLGLTQEVCLCLQLCCLSVMCPEQYSAHLQL